jgi:4-amino-4-deoxy-L-arabinose transferase-like glycosyltransferase
MTSTVERKPKPEDAISTEHTVVAVPSPSPTRVRGWVAGLVHGRRWRAIAGLAAIAILALVLYTWSLSRNGMANSYYAAAVKSATISWKAFFFGSLDPGSFITVDKPPLAIWVMALFGRVFKFSTWSMLVPQALAGVASVLVLHRLTRRWRGNIAALLAALALALTPVAVLIFRYNNPDAFLTLLILTAAWAFWSALEKGSTWKLVLTGVILGFAFLTKMLMGLMVLPVFGLVYLMCGPHRLGRRVLQLLAALGALVVSAGWWVAIVELWPNETRPHVGGTTTDSWIDLIFSRSAGILESTTQGANLSGDPGWLRIFNEQLGGQVAWLLPLALAGLVAGLAVTLRAPRADRRRAGYLLWGLWSLVMIAAFDVASGTLHSYYTVVLAPGAAALAGAGAVELWRLGCRRRWLAWLLPGVVAGTAVWSSVLLGRVSGYVPGLAATVLALGFTGAAGLLLALLLPPGTRPPRLRLRQVSVLTAATLSTVALLAGPFAYSASTVGRTVTGNTAAAGPRTSGPNLSSSSGSDLSVDQVLLAYLVQNQGDAKYLVAVQATSESVAIILATGKPVVTIGGYKSRDPYPTAAELESMVAGGDLRYVWLASSSGSTISKSSGSGSSASREILQAVTDWVTANGIVVDATEFGGSTKGTLYYLGG